MRAHAGCGAACEQTTFTGPQSTAATPSSVPHTAPSPSLSQPRLQAGTAPSRFTTHAPGALEKAVAFYGAAPPAGSSWEDPTQQTHLRLRGHGQVGGILWPVFAGTGVLSVCLTIYSVAFDMSYIQKSDMFMEGDRERLAIKKNLSSQNNGIAAVPRYVCECENSFCLTRTCLCWPRL